MLMQDYNIRESPEPMFLIYQTEL